MKKKEEIQPFGQHSIEARSSSDVLLSCIEKCLRYKTKLK